MTSDRSSEGVISSASAHVAPPSADEGEMAASDDDARDRRRVALATAFAEVTSGRRVRFSAELSIPEVLLSDALRGTAGILAEGDGT